MNSFPSRDSLRERCFGTASCATRSLVKPEAILEVIKRQRLPDDWVISIFDANGLRMARWRAHKEHLAGRASASRQTLMAPGAQEGVG